MPDQQQKINIEVSPEEAEGIYSNLAIVSHSPSEFIVDFTRVLPGIKKAKIYARIVLAPQHAKLLMNALRENIEKYEKRFGEIKIVRGPREEIGFKKPEDK